MRGGWVKMMSTSRFRSARASRLTRADRTYILFFMRPGLQTQRQGGATVREIEQAVWRLELPQGPARAYRWAQLDDYLTLARRNFHWSPPLRLELRARVSAKDLPGTWGFGLWNDPFSASLGIGGAGLRLPALPNTAWFFYAGEPNYLAFKDNHPARGLLAATFTAPRLPALLLAPGVLTLPLLALPPVGRLLRRVLARLVGESAATVPADPTVWHTYRLDWSAQQVTFALDGQAIASTPVTPSAPLGLVLWIDNQYAAFPPSGKLRMGTSANAGPAWLELAGIEIIPG